MSYRAPPFLLWHSPVLSCTVVIIVLGTVPATRARRRRLFYSIYTSGNTAGSGELPVPPLIVSCMKVVSNHLPNLYPDPSNLPEYRKPSFSWNKTDALSDLTEPEAFALLYERLHQQPTYATGS